MKSRVAALALAVPLLFTAPALADHGKSKRTSASVSINTGAAGLTLHVGNRGHNRHHNTYSRYDGHRYNRDLSKHARRSCRAAILDQAHYIGFRDVDFDSRARVHQFGPRGFEVTFNEVEFEGRRREFERRVSCVVKNGRVHDIYGIPQPRSHRHNRSYY